MPNWNLKELMSAATARIGHRADIAKSDVSFWVNVAYAEVAEAAEHNELQRLAITSVASGDSRIEMPENASQVLNLSYFTENMTSAKTLERIAPEAMDSVGFHPHAQPRRYAEYNDWLTLWPSPDSGYSIIMRYKSYASDMLGEAEIPSVASDMRKAILYLAESHLHDLIGNEEEAMLAQGKYHNYISSVKDSRAKMQASRGQFKAQLVRRHPRGRVSSRSYIFDRD